MQIKDKNDVTPNNDNNESETYGFSRRVEAAHLLRDC